MDKDSPTDFKIRCAMDREPMSDVPLKELIFAHWEQREPLSSPFEQLKFYCNRQPNVRKPVIYQPGLVVVAQGEKQAHCGSQTLRYNAGQLLVLTAPLPIECQVVSASSKEPYLAAIIPLLGEHFSALSADLDVVPSPESEVHPGITVTALCTELKSAIKRFLQTLLCPETTRALGTAHLREVYYYALKSEAGEHLRSYLSSGSHTRQLAQVLQRIHSDLAESYTVEQLAEEANLSPSAFHRAFKRLTSESPLRYIKKMKLHKAYSLMHYEGQSVSEAAESVGYQSPSQFSREFKRLYGKSPSELLKESKQK